MKKLLLSILTLGLILTGCSTGSNGPKDLSEVKIGVIQLMQHSALDQSYEGFKDVFLNIYNTVSDGYLEDKLTSREIESYFDNLYTVNEYYLSFLNYLEDSDYKVIVTRGLSFYKSITEEDKTKIFVKG